jgi:hypothetical protein
MSDDPKKNSNIVDWGVETIRVTGFPISTSTGDTEWWGKLISESPETKISRPKEGIYRDEGPFENGKLVLSVQPMRIDWLYTVNIQESEVLPVLGSFHVVQDHFLDIVRRWLKICNPIKRLAFGVILVHPVASREEGYKAISHYLPNVQLDVVNSSDFLYQINRPRISQTSDVPIIINRLSKWLVAKVQRLHIDLSVAEKVSPSILPYEGLHACRLELDINTSPEVDQLPGEKMVPLFDELVSLAREIAEKGDI